MKRIIVVFASLIAGVSLFSQTTVDDVRFNQIDNQIAVTYSIKGGGMYDAQLYYTTNDGETWKGPLKTIVGDLRNVTSGMKTITWDVLKDEENLIAMEIKFKVVLTESKDNVFIDPRDQHVYRWMKFGRQCWMIDNLQTYIYNDGASIMNITDATSWEELTTGAYCNYGNNISNVNTYGRLYNWYAVNTGKLCPLGWHIPTEDEWSTLEKYLISNSFGSNGVKNDNTIAKAMASTLGWKESMNMGAIGNDPTKNNRCGFSAMPAGYRNIDGRFINLGQNCYFWSSTESGKVSSYRYLSYFSGNSIYSLSHDKNIGFSIRCIKD